MCHISPGWWKGKQRQENIMEKMIPQINLERPDIVHGAHKDGEIGHVKEWRYQRKRYALISIISESIEDTIPEQLAGGKFEPYIELER